MQMRINTKQGLHASLEKREKPNKQKEKREKTCYTLLIAILSIIAGKNKTLQSRQKTSGRQSKRHLKRQKRMQAAILSTGLYSFSKKLDLTGKKQAARIQSGLSMLLGILACRRKPCILYKFFLRPSADRSADRSAAICGHLRTDLRPSADRSAARSAAICGPICGPICGYLRLSAARSAAICGPICGPICGHLRPDLRPDLRPCSTLSAARSACIL